MLKVGIHQRLFSWKHHAEREDYKIQTSKVLFKRVAESILKNLFSATKCAITWKNSTAMKKNVLYRCRPLPSENMCQISQKGNQK